MKKILSIILLFTCVILTASAQVKSGDIVTGQIWDDLEPLPMANVIEVDKSKRIVSHCVTDYNGNFSLKITNPKNIIRVSYIGCVTKDLPITKRALGRIVLASNTTLKEVTVKAVRKSQTSGLQIPVREISGATQTIDMKEFEGIGMTSVDEALQGRISGLDIVANSGNLGAGTTMRLRGVSTINGNANPLIVVNGNVFENDATKDFDYTNANEERFAELLCVNPEDIQEITVLKDAATTAIWGSQGANGVIEIKTKRGSRGQTKVTYSYRFSGSWQPEGYKLLNGDDYTMYLKEAYFNPTQTDGYGNPNSSLFVPEIAYNKNFSEYNMFNDNTDWRKEIQQFGQNHQHFVSLEGGGDKATFRVSLGYDMQTGTIIKQRLDRITNRVALDYFVSDRIKVQTNFDLSYTRNKKNYRPGGNDLLAIALEKMPNVSVYEEDEYGNDTDHFYTMDKNITKEQGTFAAQGKLLEDQYGLANPVAVAYLAKNTESTVKLSPEFILSYELLGTADEPNKHKLKYEGQIVFDIFSKDEDTFLPGTILTQNFTGDDYNVAGRNAYKSHSLSTRHTLTFTPHFNNEDHSLMFMSRYQYNYGTSSSQNLEEKGLPTAEGVTSPLAGGINKAFGSGSGEWKSQFFLFQAHYAYKGKYIVDATLRVDGSTKFGPARRWGKFPGLSFRWNIVDEPWMERFKWLDMLSIRPGWGRVGNQPGQEGLFYSKYKSNGLYMGVNAVEPSNIRLADLRWEEQDTWNLGFDFGFWEKISGDLSIYTKTTRSLLNHNSAIPSSTGFSSLSVKNTGSMRNNGWEFNINAYKLVQIGSKFSMDFNVTFANNRNEILDMEQSILETMNGDGNTPDNGKYLSMVRLNNPLGAIYGYRYKGVYRYSDYYDAVDAIEATIEAEAKKQNLTEDAKAAMLQQALSDPSLAPVVRNANGDIVYDSKGAPKYMVYDYENKDYHFVGGDAMYEDINHDGQINALDVVYLGSSLPKMTGGFGFKMNYGPWSMNVQFNYRYGNKVINAARMGLENMSNNSNQSQAINWRWHNEGDVALLPRAASTSQVVTNNINSATTHNYLGSDRFVEDASFVRLNYVQIAYQFKPAFIKQMGLDRLRLSATLNNLFCITKYSGADPEVVQAGYTPATDNSRTPRARSFTLNALVAF